MNGRVEAADAEGNSESTSGAGSSTIGVIEALGCLVEFAASSPWDVTSGGWMVWALSASDLEAGEMPKVAANGVRIDDVASSDEVTEA
jgi:hypothetical protein